MEDPLHTVEFDDAFAGLYLRARQATFGILGDLRAAEDVAAEALVRARLRWRHVRTLPHREAWVLRTATGAAFDVRRRSVRPSSSSGPDPDQDRDLVALDPELVDALARLPRRPREAVVLVQLLGCSCADTAAAMNESEGAVEQLIRRGVDRVGDRLPTAGVGRSTRAVD